MFPASSKMWLINISLVAVIILLGIMSVDVWTRKDEAIQTSQSVEDTGSPRLDKRIIERVVPPGSTYEIVAENNLFSPDRTAPQAEEAQPGTANISGEMVFLYGVMSFGDKKQALVSIPESGSNPRGRQLENKLVRVGDAIGNLKVAEIRKDKIILREGTARYEIFLHDENKPAKQSALSKKSATPTVIVTGSKPTTAAAPPPGGPASSPPASSARSGSAAVKSEPEAEYKIVDTLFGPIKRRIK